MENDGVREILNSYYTAVEFWEELFDIDVIDDHECFHMSEDNSSKIIKVTDDISNAEEWFLLNARLATFYDVEISDAERVADVQSASMVAVNFCRFVVAGWMKKNMGKSHNKYVNRMFFATLRFAEASPIQHKTPLHKKRLLRRCWAEQL